MTLFNETQKWGDNDYSEIFSRWVRQETGEPDLTNDVQKMNDPITEFETSEHPIQMVQDNDVDLECNELYLLAQQLESRGVQLEAYMMWRQTQALESIASLIQAAIERDNAELPNFMFRAPGRE